MQLICETAYQTLYKDLKTFLNSEWETKIKDIYKIMGGKNIEKN